MKREAPPAKTPRGRPPSITRERIADAGIRIGLPDLTFIGVAEALGVSHTALYKHVASLEELRQFVAEEIFRRWEIPPPGERGELASYLGQFVTSLRALVKTHPGLPAFLMRQSATTQRMLDKIDAHHRAVARTFGLPKKQAGWLLSTIAFHCIAVADMVFYASAPPAELPPAKRRRDEATMEREFTKGMHALIIGALCLLGRNTPAPGPEKP